MPTDTKEKTLKLSLSMIQRRSFSSFSYDDISRKLGVTKAAIHYHFESKADLGMALCERIKKAMQDRYEQSLNGIRTRREHPWNFIENIISTIGPGDNCPISSLQADYENLPARLQEKIRELSELQLELFRSLVREYAPRLRNEDFVVTAFLGIKGALLYRRILGQKFFVTSLQSIRKQFDSSLKEQTGAGKRK
ncbi:TetR/AcrR family transcriptional regulator [Brucepastera parasyntrophica]|uniref:TetR/AcrR family transcriptional regulator n=1 Tax=Brucepastera parasyntrophica TaxID=2880008 RepID=UPI002108EFB4|nr:TetR/AcrR family transcriptional regulator [Brucepastera parasyntrophica]ULQ60984.1 TetR/AcrR family transcriptional regulator [Brucepastera parasyntrophica]